MQYRFHIENGQRLQEGHYEKFMIDDGPLNEGKHCIY